eukprot:CAMPEP_0180182576 /NCGR_PEP_ID=MMETSP0986-20121125/40742_1 /TAXON_ID=697907 /ORGANISM="non described non described, Strain CCMP2293" /LENGTH=423 /DNA_ID=CAMNT_0022135959 /DNA_START=32 /DNA_END=1303 /DNA_ORIENTATION=+
MSSSRGLLAVLLFSTAAHLDAFAPAPALWRSGTAPLRSATVGRSRTSPRMAVSEPPTATEAKAKKEAEAAAKAAILEIRRAESKQAGDPSGKSTTKPSVKPIDLLTKWSWGMHNAKFTMPIDVVEGQAPEPTNAVTQEHLDTLFRDGVVHIPGVLQRCPWRTNMAYLDFMLYSPVANVMGKIAGCGWFPEGDANGHEIRISTDLLLVNPNTGLKWHQDEQNGPLTAGRGETNLDALRYWVTMDDTPLTFGGPVYLKGSHNNDFVHRDEVFVRDDAALLQEFAPTTFRAKAGDMIIWHPKVIHKVEGAPDGWGTAKRRVIGGTAAIDRAVYQDEEEHSFGAHGLKHGDLLKSGFFPKIFPQSELTELEDLRSGKVGRSGDLYRRMFHTLQWYVQMKVFGTSIETIQKNMKGLKTKIRTLTSTGP